jgi:hypothetical protein
LNRYELPSITHFKSAGILSDNAIKANTIEEGIMIYWGVMLFCLGLLALVDYSITGGRIFGPINSAVFLTISFAIFVRIRRKQKDALWEKLAQENDELKKQLEQQGSSTRIQRERQEAGV